jgi:hypothetical protein
MKKEKRKTKKFFSPDVKINCEDLLSCIPQHGEQEMNDGTLIIYDRQNK